jgi:hypothetical protein
MKVGTFDGRDGGSRPSTGHDTVAIVPMRPLTRDRGVLGIHQNDDSFGLGISDVQGS